MQTVSLRQMLLNGVRPESWTARDSQFLIRCQNRRPTDGGLKDFYALTQPLTDTYISTTLSESKAWPFPQFFVGRSVALCCFEDAIYEVDIDAGTASAIDTKDPDDDTGGTSASITAGKDWHFLDLHDTWMLFNGACVVWRTGRNGYTWATDDVTIQTGCAHRDGRALFAGFDATDFYSRVNLPAAMALVAGDLPTEFSSLTLSGAGANWVWWSSVLAPDLLWLLDSSVGTDQTLMQNLAWRNESGLRPLPGAGDRLGLVEFGPGVLVYGEDHICRLDPVGSTYAPRQFAGLPDAVGVTPGANTRTHWAGDQHMQFFIDGEDALWALGTDLRAERLGYSEHIADLDRDDLLLAWDGAHQELYAADGTMALLWAKGRLCRAPWMPTRIAVRAGDIVTAEFEIADPDTATVETGTISTQSGRVETLTRIWMKGLHNRGFGWTVQVKSRIRGYDDWITSAALTPDSRGVVTCAIPVLEYRLVLTSVDQTGVSLEDIQVETTEATPQMADKLAAAVPGAATE